METANNIVALDRASVRSKDENGYLHVANSHISRAQVAPYYGKEIPGWREEGLEPDKVYYGLRDPEELKKSIPTWAGLPLHIEHHIDSAEDPQKLTRVGAIGNGAVWNEPYLDAPLTVWDQTAIDGIEDDSFRELSCAYRYEPDFTPGEYGGKHYDFVMRNIRGNHVALVREGRAGPDVLVADARPHGLDTVEDGADKAADLRAIAETLRGKLPPEEAGRLISAISALAAAETGGKEPMVVEEKQNVHADAMRAAGCDAESPEEARAFAAGVKYGEGLERDPAERAKLDREHESEGMEKALDKCGSDGENPGESEAFAEGVKYGEKLEANPEEREKLDREHESEGMKKAMDEDKNAMIERILAEVPGLTDEQKAKLRDSLQDLAYDPATGDKKPVCAADGAPKQPVVDVAQIRAQTQAAVMAQMKELYNAVRRVRPLVGEMDPMCMGIDNADDVYAAALAQMGKDPKSYDRKAWRGMVDVMLDSRATLAADAALMLREKKSLPDSGPFRFLKNIR